MLRLRLNSDALRVLGPLAVLVAAAATADTTPLDQRIKALSEQLEQARVDQHIPGLAIVVVKDDEVILSRGFGQRDLDADLPVTEETLFAIGSTTKAFTSTLIGMLVDEGKMDWDDLVRKHVPRFELKDKTANEQVTIRDLLCHRTGLGRMPLLWAANQASPRRIISQISRAEPIAEFRESWHYNNVMFCVAGMAATQAAGVDDWSTLLQQRILDPLGMADTHTSVPKMRDDALASKGYRWDEDSQDWDCLPMRVLDRVAPAGAINSNVRDMAHWLRFLLAHGEYDGQRLISERQLDETWKPQVAMGPGGSYALGWMTETWQDHDIVQHGGNIDGFSAMVAMIPDQHIGFVLMMNVGVAPLQQTSRAMVWQALLGESVADSTTDSAPDTGALSAEQLQAYVGKYRLEAIKADAQVLIKNDRLAIDIPGQMVFPLKWPDENGRWKFDFPAEIEIEFEEPENGVVPSATMYQVVELTLPRKQDGPPPVPLAEKLPDPGEAWSHDLLEPLVGKYRVGPGDAGIWTILIKDDELAVDIPGQTQWPLHWPDKDSRWKIKVDTNQSLEFKTDSKHRATKLTFRRLLVMPMPRIKANAALDITLDDLFALRADEHLEALKDQRLRFTGDMNFVQQGVRAKLTVFVDGAGRTMMHMNADPFGYTKSFLAGDEAWIDSNLETPEEIDGVKLELAKLDHPFVAFGDWRGAFKDVTLLKKDQIDGQDVYIVECTPHKGAAIRKYLSAETGLVVRQDAYIPNEMLGSVPTTTTYGDFREVLGVKMPFLATVENKHTGKAIIRFKEVETDVKIPRHMFDPPEKQ